jgi:hypothetical protein
MLNCSCSCMFIVLRLLSVFDEMLLTYLRVILQKINSSKTIVVSIYNTFGVLSMYFSINMAYPPYKIKYFPPIVRIRRRRNKYTEYTETHCLVTSEGQYFERKLSGELWPWKAKRMTLPGRTYNKFYHFIFFCKIYPMGIRNKSYTPKKVKYCTVVLNKVENF